MNAGDLRQHTMNYQKAGGTSSFANYFATHHDSAILDKELLQGVVFANHNLVTDRSFGEVQMIVCRNVLIYFNQDLQNKVLRLFYESLCPGGILCLGPKESLRLTSLNKHFIELDKEARIFQKKYE